MAAQPVNGHAAPADNDSQTSKVQPSDVGWQFVPQYYNFVNKQPHRLHCFYNKRSTFIHGEEGDEAEVALGQTQIHDRIEAIGYDNCKVFIHSIDSQSSANGGIIILVIGEMSNKDSPWRKFTQTFFLAEQPNGYFVLNDIFRYLKEDVEEEEFEEEPANQEAAVEIPAEASHPVPAADPVPVPPTSAPTPVPEPEEPEAESQPEPEPVQAPAHPDPKAVPEEAVIASVPDKDVAPKEAAKAVEEPVTKDVPAAEASPAPAAPSPKADPSPKATAPVANGAAAQAPAQPAAPAKPSAPKSWAALAAAGGPAKAWGSATAASAPAPTPAPTPAPAAPAPAPKKEEAPAAPAASLEGKHPYYRNAMQVTTPVCFVKLPNWSPDGSAGGETMDPATVKRVASQFGEVKSVDLAKAKACAFVEFVKVESARKAIVASLTTAQGGEGGVHVEGHGRLNFEVRKDKDARGKQGGQPGGQQRGPQDAQQRGPRPQQNGERGGPSPNNRGRGRGRGGAPNGAPRQ